MSEAIDAKGIAEELRIIREDLTFIKTHMVDMDSLLSPEEETRLEESLKEYKEGKTVPLSEFKKAMRR